MLRGAFCCLVLAAPVFIVRAQVSVSDTVDQGQTCFKVTTPSARYYYQKEGCGFSSILDIQGNDWISYQPGGGAAGEYRGIPNLGWQFHPGYTNGGVTTLVTSTATKATLRSEANGWIGTWDFYATHAVFTLAQRQDTYWFLYEGTPGGRMEPSRDYYYVPDNSQPAGVRRAPASEDRNADLSPEWIAFGDPAMKRMLVLAHHDDDNLRDDYYDMGGDGGMTVFGFGRNNSQSPCWYCMNAAPSVFTIALIEDTVRANVKAFALSAIAGTVTAAEPPQTTARRVAHRPGGREQCHLFDMRGRALGSGREAVAGVLVNGAGAARRYAFGSGR